jgi:very-short-patch-repair endonuclease
MATETFRDHGLVWTGCPQRKHRGRGGHPWWHNLSGVLDDIVNRQDGVVTRTQALTAGMSEGAVRSRLDSGWWRTLFRSTYVTFTGPVPRRARLWAAVLYAGADAVLSHESAAELVGLVDEADDDIYILVPTARRVYPAPGLVIRRSRRVEEARHPLRSPPQTRVEETVVDLTQTSYRLGDAIGWITRACGRRLTRPERIGAAIDARRKLRWRAELLATVTDVGSGAHSPLEVRYLRDVERAHGLPRGSRQHAVVRSGRRFYDDVRYAAYGVVVELDGRVYHPDEARWRDMSRDNASVLDGRRVLRFGWADVAAQPCSAATQVATVLRTAGWRGAPRRCAPTCSVITEGFGSHGYRNLP